MILALFFTWSFLYSLFSFALTDPNLVLIRFAPYQTFQYFMWNTIFTDRLLLSSLYLLLILLGFGLYLYLLRRLNTSAPAGLVERVENCVTQRSDSFSIGAIFSGRYKKKLLGYVLILLPLLFSYNALSHDVFNYIFNAKMVVQYQANPHEKVALDYSTDPWTRFMHNTHTPAPYGYGWTILSLLPFGLGFGRFFLTWIFFKLFALLSIVALYTALQYLSVALRRKYLTFFELALIFCNPLFLIEVVSNAHNDLWMLIPAIVSLGIVLEVFRKKYVPITWLTLSALALAASIFVKLATVVLLPIWIAIVALHALKLSVLEKLQMKISIPLITSLLNGGTNMLVDKYAHIIPLVASFLLFLPLLTARSQQFHPWYLLWPFVWIPFIRNTFWRTLLIAFSFSSMFRYLPWLYNGGYDGGVLSQQKSITWGVALLLLVLMYAIHYSRKSKTQTVLYEK